jgi:hypothetical protein
MVEDFAFQVPIWVVLPVVLLLGLGLLKVVKLLVVALRG